MERISIRTDAELIRAADHDADAFAELYDRYARDAVAWARRGGVREPDVIDVVAEVFGQAWRSRRRFRDPGDGGAGAWLHGIARRRIARLGIVPAVVLTSAAGAVAFVPQLGDPAPRSLTEQLNRDRPLSREMVGPKLADHLELPRGERLTLAAVGEHRLIYAAVEPSAAWCAADTGMGGRLEGWVCHEASKAGRSDEVVFMKMGGGWTRAQNIVAGRVEEPSARTVQIHLPGHSEPIVTPVQRLGFFIAQLPYSTLRSQHPTSLSATALDADGNVVANSRWYRHSQLRTAAFAGRG